MNSGVLWRVLRRAAIRGTMIRKQVALATIVHCSTLSPGIMTRAAMSIHSRYGRRVRRRYEGQVQLLPAGAPDRARMQRTYQVLRTQGLDPGAALRTLRQLVLERLLCLDCRRTAPLPVITQAMTELAEFVLQTACSQAQALLAPVHGQPAARTAIPPSSGWSAWASWVPASSMSPATST